MYLAPFGPWSIQTLKTQRENQPLEVLGHIFTCLDSGAIHIEILESMDTSSFISDLIHFFEVIKVLISQGAGGGGGRIQNWMMP